jgi:hypothetical protein
MDGFNWSNNVGQFDVTVNFHAKDPLPGDLDGNGQVNVQDATLSLKIGVRLVLPNEEQKVAGDVNNDGKLNIQDTTLILQKAVGLP